jgi:hypothetical protein
MGWESKANREYEKRVIQDLLDRFDSSFDIVTCPLDKEELYTLAKRFRESMYGSDKKKEKLKRFIEHLGRLYEPTVIAPVAERLEAVNNEIGYEEK